MTTDGAGHGRVAGVADRLAPGLVRLLAPNPSAMTERGTNTYVLGEQTLCIIDPGPDDPHHLAALLAHIGDRPVSRIIVTHTHTDHCGLARGLSRAADAPVLGFGDSLAGRSVVMQQLASSDRTGGGKGMDTGFVPDQTLVDGAVLWTDSGPLRVLHTPGHCGNHICLRWGDAVFSGDQVMGWATSLVSPPDGDLTDFMTSCARLRDENAVVLYPGHGAPVADPYARIGWLIDHRRGREAQILAQLNRGPQTVAALTTAIYTDTPAPLHPAACRNVLAHLVDLVGRNLVQAQPTLHSNAVFRRI